MNEKELKFANQLFWQVKGHLIPDGWSEIDIQQMSDSYFKRLWGNNEAYVYLDDFEEAWKNRLS